MDNMSSGEDQERYTLSRYAEDSLYDILSYIDEDNPQAADKLECEFFAAFARIATMPSVGFMREDLTNRESVRFYIVRKYFIVYRIDLDPIRIIMVRAGVRDFSADLFD